MALQKEWKTIGMVPKKLGDQLWEEFLGACNKFFEARKAAGVGQHSEEHANLSKKREVIAKLKAVAEEAMPSAMCHSRRRIRFTRSIMLCSTNSTRS